MDIQTLLISYNENISELEKELADIKHKRDVLQEAFEMLTEGSISRGKISSINNIAVVSGKYSNMTWPQAILLALTDNEEMTGDQLLINLIENGFESKSKSIKSDMYGRLKTLEEKGKVLSIKEGKNFKRYRLMKGGN